MILLETDYHGLQALIDFSLTRMLKSCQVSCNQKTFPTHYGTFLLSHNYKYIHFAH